MLLSSFLHATTIWPFLSYLTWLTFIHGSTFKMSFSSLSAFLNRHLALLFELIRRIVLGNHFSGPLQSVSMLALATLTCMLSTYNLLKDLKVAFERMAPRKWMSSSIKGTFIYEVCIGILYLAVYYKDVKSWNKGEVANKVDIPSKIALVAFLVLFLLVFLVT